MKNFRHISFSLVAFLLAVTTACVKEEPVIVEFESAEYLMTVGQTRPMAQELVVSNSAETPLFTSSDEAVATVTAEGLLTALAAGEATLTANVEGVAASCRIKVSASVKADSINVTGPENLEAGGAWGKIRATVSPKEYDKENLSWTFTPNIEGLSFEYKKDSADVYQLCFGSYMKDGKVTVKVSDPLSGLADSVVVAVTDRPVEATKVLLKAPESLTALDFMELWAKASVDVEPTGYDTRHLVWEFASSADGLKFKTEKLDHTGYKVSFGNFVENAYLEITVRDTISRKFDMRRLRVLEKPEKGLSSMAISPSPLLSYVGDKPVSFKLNHDPAVYDPALIQWSSSDEDVATVEDGVLTVKKTGVTIVRADDILSDTYAECEVTVGESMDDFVPKSMSLSESHIRLKVGRDVRQLVVTFYDGIQGHGASIRNNQEVEWIVDEDLAECVTVDDNGLITPKMAGEGNVVARYKKDPQISASCRVVVEAEDVLVTRVGLYPKSMNLKPGETFRLTPQIYPSDATSTWIGYGSSDPDVATVSENGTVTAVSNGRTEITATASSGVSGKCVVVVADSWVELSDTELTLVKGSEKQLTAEIVSDKSAGTVTWKSSDPAVASVSDGKITAVKEGTAFITASADGCESAECKVVVETEAVPFSFNLTIPDDHVRVYGLEQDMTTSLLAVYRREDNTDYAPAMKEWRSSDPAIATVDAKGNVTAVIDHIAASGYDNGKDVTITHVADGVTKTIVMKIVKAQPRSVVLTEWPVVDGVEGYAMMHRSSFTFKAKVLPEKASQYVWFAGGGKTQLNNDTYQAENVGEFTFTAYAGDNVNVRTDFVVKVLEIPLTEMVLSNTEMEMNLGSRATLSVDFVPDDASFTTLVWSSSDETVAAVDQNGEVKALREGEAVITAKQQKENDGEGLSRTCKVKVVRQEGACYVGDYFYSTGKVSSSPDEDKATFGEVIGVVFSNDNPALGGDAALASGYSGCTHGYVISTRQYTSSYADDVEWTKVDFAGWMRDNGHDHIFELNGMCGYSNTVALRQINDAAVSSNRDQIRVDLIADIDAHAAAVSAPGGTSGWYLPSYKEMMRIRENLDVLNRAMAAIEGDQLAKTYTYSFTQASDGVTKTNTKNQQYWHSTFDENNFQAFDMNTGTNVMASHIADGFVTSTGAATQLPVRIILAF